MPVQVVALYATVVLIWGSTWAVIPYQLGDVAPELSVGYRFAIAALLLYAFAAATGRRIGIGAGAYPFVFLQGMLLFCLNYFLVYYATERITTGLIAVVFSSIVICNAMFERVFFATMVDGRVLLAALFGTTGIAMIFWPEVSAVSIADDTIIGILLVLASTICASLGNMTAVVNTRKALSVIAVNSHAMAFASVLSVVLALSLGRPLAFSLHADYLWSLAYLAVFGSAVAFGCYLSLIRRIGASRAAYSSVLFPVVALGLSTLFEGYRWTVVATLGIMLTLAGNWLILKRPRQPVPTPDPLSES